MFSVPSIDDCKDFAKALGCTYIREISINPRSFDEPFMCHQNCDYNPVLGYYFVKDENSILHAFKHSVLKLGDKLYDVTPTLDNRTYNIFAFGTQHKNEHFIYLDNSVCIYNHNKQRYQDMFYVYGLIDPRTNLPFYIGKGQGDRWKFHFSDKSLYEGYNDRKRAKIKKLKKLGYDIPVVEFYAQNIEDEEIAYKIEKELILKYGRIGFEEYGILTNLSSDANPPNWKGKSYDFIYGDKATDQKEKRTKLQKERGGYFGGQKHTKESKAKISATSKGQRNGRYSGHDKNEILRYGKEFCDFFDNKISLGKWKWWSNHRGIPTNIIKNNFRFDNKHLFEIFEEEFGAKKTQYSLLWFHNPKTKQTFRTEPWKIELGIDNIPKEMIPGRGKGSFTKKKKETEISSYIVGGVKNDVDEGTFKGFSL